MKVLKHLFINIYEYFMECLDSIVESLEAPWKGLFIVIVIGLPLFLIFNLGLTALNLMAIILNKTPGDLMYSWNSSKVTFILSILLIIFVFAYGEILHRRNRKN